MPDLTMLEEDEFLGGNKAAEEDGIPTAEEAGIPEEDRGIPAGIPVEADGIPEDVNGIPDEKTTTAKVKPSTKTIVADLKIGEESFDDTIRRIFGVYHDLTSELENARSVNKGIREDLHKEQQRYEQKFGEQVHEIGGLKAQVTTLTGQIEKGLVSAGEQSNLEVFGSLGMKDIADEIIGSCKGEENCVGTVVKLQQTRIAAMSKHMDRDHDGEQRRLAREHDAAQRQIELDAKREGQEKDRALKAELAEKEHDNRIELALAKKGGFKQEVLEDIVFVGAGGSKHPRKDMADAERRAHHAATNKDDEDWMTKDIESEEELAMHPGFEEDEV